MVTPTDPQATAVQEEQITDISPATEVEETADIPAEGDNASQETETADAAPAEASPNVQPGESAIVETTESTIPFGQQQTSQVNQQSISELHSYRTAEVERQWRENIGNQAVEYEQRLTQAGYLPEQARDQARRYVLSEQKFREQERESSNMIGFVEGRQAAAAHFMKKHKLANQQMLDDLTALQRANTPAEMEREAQRIQRERTLLAENARLKQGRVAPQTFDDSQGAAEATTNQDRLLSAYLSGDRSDAAVQAAKKLTFGA